MSMECKVRDITMTYEEVGTGRPLLVLDGWGYSGQLTMIGSEPVYEGRTQLAGGGPPRSPSTGWVPRQSLGSVWCTFRQSRAGRDVDEQSDTKPDRPRRGPQVATCACIPYFESAAAIALDCRRLVDLQTSSAADKRMVGEQLRRGVQVGGLDYGPAVEWPVGKTVLRTIA